jgi:hypothetical protein
MQQTADWLEKLGTSEYAQLFAENGINVEALRYLTEQDLKDIGVLLGHRRISLAAIGEFAAPAVAKPFVPPRSSQTLNAPPSMRQPWPLQRPRPGSMPPASAATSR